MGSSWARDRIHVSCIGSWILNHWTNRAAQWKRFYDRGSDGRKEMEVVVMEVVAVEMGMEVVIEART